MRAKLGNDEALLQHLLPTDFAVGCRRPTPGNGYLEALTKDNVRVICAEEGIDQVVPDGLRLSLSSGGSSAPATSSEPTTVKVDTIICATGFDLSFCPRFELVGRGGESIHEAWKDVPEAYLSTAVPGFPNYFSTCCRSINVILNFFQFFFKSFETRKKS